MHIEVGIIDPARLVFANAAALTIVASQLAAVFRPGMRKNTELDRGSQSIRSKGAFNLVKSVLAAFAFSTLMQAWHLPVGPSELHLIGATTVYVLFGFVPAMLGFALGLLLQAFVFEPGDIPHLGVNALSLMIPMIVTHATFGHRLFESNLQQRFTLSRVLRLDCVYYAGVSAMVGFWLMISNDGLAVTDWVRWVVAYAPVFAAEAVLTFGTANLLRLAGGSGILGRITDVGRLRFA